MLTLMYDESLWNALEMVTLWPYDNTSTTIDAHQLEIRQREASTICHLVLSLLQATRPIDCTTVQVLKKVRN